MATFNQIGSGGLTAAGSPTIRLITSPSTSGGAKVAGSAINRQVLPPACHCTTFSQPTSGGFKFGGQSTITDNVIRGGFRLGGSATILTVGNPYEDFAALYPLSEDGAESPIYLDHSGNNLDGTGGILPDGTTEESFVPIVTDGVGCQLAQQFSGIEYIGTDPDCLIPSQAFSISCWAKIQTFGKAWTFVSRGYDSGDDSHWICSLGHTFLNQICFSVQTINGATLTVNTVQGATILERDITYHFAATFTPGQSINVYVNGVMANTRAITGTQTPNNDTGNFIGRLNTGSYPTTIIQEVRLHGVARSADWFLAETNDLCGSFYYVSAEENTVYG